MAITPVKITNIFPSNTFGDLIRATDNVISGFNFMAFDDFIKPTGSLILNEPVNYGLTSLSKALFNNKVDIQGTGSSLYVQNSTEIAETLFLTNGNAAFPTLVASGNCYINTLILSNSNSLFVSGKSLFSSNVSILDTISGLNFVPNYLNVKTNAQIDGGVNSSFITTNSANVINLNSSVGTFNYISSNSIGSSVLSSNTFNSNSISTNVLVSDTLRSNSSISTNLIVTNALRSNSSISTDFISLSILNANTSANIPLLITETVRSNNFIITDNIVANTLRSNSSISTNILTSSSIQANSFVNTSIVFTNTFRANGNVTCDVAFANVYTSLSDIEFKSNIETLNNPFDVLNNIRPVSFEWKNTNKKSYGVIAQELENILPELVSENDGVKLVEYQGLISFLISAVKELSERVNILENK